MKVLEDWKRVCEAVPKGLKTKGRWIDDHELVIYLENEKDCFASFDQEHGSIPEFTVLAVTALPVAIETLERAIEALQIILDPSGQGDFIQSLSAKDIAFEALEQIHARLESYK